jgi:hypothetical protein
MMPLRTTVSLTARQGKEIDWASGSPLAPRWHGDQMQPTDQNFTHAVRTIPMSSPNVNNEFLRFHFPWIIDDSSITRV